MTITGVIMSVRSLARQLHFDKLWFLVNLVPFLLCLQDGLNSR